MLASNSELLMAGEAADRVARHVDEVFPALTEAEIARIRRFGETRRYEHGEQLFAAGEPGPGNVRGARGRRDDQSTRWLGACLAILNNGAYFNHTGTSLEPASQATARRVADDLMTGSDTLLASLAQLSPQTDDAAPVRVGARVLKLDPPFLLDLRCQSAHSRN